MEQEEWQTGILFVYTGFHSAPVRAFTVFSSQQFYPSSELDRNGPWNSGGVLGDTGRMIPNSGRQIPHFLGFSPYMGAPTLVSCNFTAASIDKKKRLDTDVFSSSDYT